MNTRGADSDLPCLALTAARRPLRYFLHWLASSTVVVLIHTQQDVASADEATDWG